LIELFLNGVYVRPDVSLPALPLNGQRQYTTSADAFPVFVSQAFAVGDVIGLKITTTRVEQVDWQTSLGNIEQHAGLGAGIAAFEDGTLTNELWRCSTEEVDNWHTDEFDDSRWPFAVVQDRDCCPWRDQTWKWNRLNAKWIAPANFDASGEGIGYCRYKIPNGDRLMDSSSVEAATSAPSLNVTAIALTANAAGVTVSTSERCNVFCILCDARFILRTPTPLEVEAAGNSMEVDGWIDVTVGNHQHHYDIEALHWYQAGSYAQCQALCDNYQPSPCSAITYFVSGVDPITKQNCKLMEKLDNSKLILNSTLSPHTVRHIARQIFPASRELSIAGTLYPGTLYTAYCSARSVYTNKHSTWAAVEASRLTGRTDKCADCGASPLPIVKIMGGWASKDAISPVVWSSQPGRVFCAARPLTTQSSPFTLTAVDIKASSIDLSQHFSLIATPGSSTFVSMTGLSPSTLHEIACMAETDTGDLSTETNLEETRQRWYTEAVHVPISLMSVVRNDADVSKVSLGLSARMPVIGFLWCQTFNATFLQQSVTPDQAALKTIGIRLAVVDIKFDATRQFLLPSATLHHQLICTGKFDDFSNVTEITIPGEGVDYPVASILRYTMDINEVQLLVFLDRGPTTTYCRAFRWARRPFSYRPLAPAIADMKASPYYQSTFNIGGAGFEMVFPGLATGSLYDIYCYSEEYVPPPPPGSLAADARGMTTFAVKETRITIKTQGPRFNDGGWTCIVGHSCKIWNIEGDGLASSDKLIAQQHQCAGRCLCNGQEDADRKGATCSQVSHERHIVPPDPHSSGVAALDGIDPRGVWCYVSPGTCYDQEQSPTFSSLWISYAACGFQNLSVDVPGFGPPDFPQNGVAQQASTRGDAYDFGVDPLFVGGASYPLCWCNGTTSSCRSLSEYNLRIGLLHMAGPTAEQRSSIMRCIAGHPCTLRQFRGHALGDGNRLVVLPDTAQGCAWQRESPGHLSSIPGFPQNATSDAAIDGGTTYSWGSTPVRADGGTYLLCWCGSVIGPDYDPKPNCPFPRPLTGASYLAPAGRLQIAGPLVGPMRFCNVGVACVIENVPGQGLQGGDKLAILNECGKSSAAPSDWTAGIGGTLPQSLTTRFVPEGWLQYGPVATDDDLIGFGAPPHTSIASSRGVFGVPNHGISISDSRPGFYTWGGAIEAEPGDYMLCWCPTEFECSKPEEFKVLVSALRLLGPLVFPSASQGTVCVRNRQCQVLNLTGVWPTAGGQLFIAGSACGGPAALGVPRNGVSLPSSNGNSFEWGPEAIQSPPAKYRLCWCYQKYACAEPEEFGSFAAILLVKSPFGPLRQFYCAIGKPCIIRDVLGEGSHVTDQIMAMSVCGDGDGATDGFEGGRAISNMTGPDGTWFEMPAPVLGGRYRMCWCAGESLCARGSDFDHDLGELVVGGPDNGALYVCYEWAACSIPGLLGSSLSDGDRIIVVPPTRNCSSVALSLVEGFPQEGLGAPAIGHGRIHGFGSDVVRSAVGVYRLCYCSVLFTGSTCNQSSHFDLRAGQLRIGTAAEYMFLTRAAEPEDRGEDGMYALLIIAPLALVAIGVMCLGVRKITNFRQHNAEKMAAQPFPKVLTLADVEKSRRKNIYAVKMIDCQRKIVNGIAAESSHEPERKGTDMLALPDMSRVPLPFFERVARPPLQALEDIAKSPQNAQLAVEDLTASPSASTYGNKRNVDSEASTSVSSPTSPNGIGAGNHVQGASPVSTQALSQSQQEEGDVESARGTSTPKSGFFSRFMPSSPLFSSRSRDPTKGEIEIREVRTPSLSPGRPDTKMERTLESAQTSPLSAWTSPLSSQKSPLSVQTSPLRAAASDQARSPASQALAPKRNLQRSSVFSVADLDESAMRDDSTFYRVQASGVFSPEHLLHFEQDRRRERVMLQVLDL